MFYVNSFLLEDSLKKDLLKPFFTEKFQKEEKENFLFYQVFLDERDLGSATIPKTSTFKEVLHLLYNNIIVNKTIHALHKTYVIDTVGINAKIIKIKTVEKDYVNPEIKVFGHMVTTESLLMNLYNFHSEFEKSAILSTFTVYLDKGLLNSIAVNSKAELFMLLNHLNRILDDCLGLSNLGDKLYQIDKIENCQIYLKEYSFVDDPEIKELGSLVKNMEENKRYLEYTKAVVENAKANGNLSSNEIIFLEKIVNGEIQIDCEKKNPIVEKEYVYKLNKNIIPIIFDELINDNCVKPMPEEIKRNLLDNLKKDYYVKLKIDLETGNVSQIWSEDEI